MYNALFGMSAILGVGDTLLVIFFAAVAPEFVPWFMVSSACFLFAAWAFYKIQMAEDSKRKELDKGL